ncbi:MAG TPA: hypothetical protein VK540_15905 [Polyangiaceae bacterium]|nr:hypothetical protein [Polyangiaceae bacterium]
MTHRCTPEFWHWLAECVARSERPELAARFDRRHPDPITSFYETKSQTTFLPPIESTENAVN